MVTRMSYRACAGSFRTLGLNRPSWTDGGPRCSFCKEHGPYECETNPKSRWYTKPIDLAELFKTEKDNG